MLFLFSFFQLWGEQAKHKGNELPFAAVSAVQHVSKLCSKPGKLFTELQTDPLFTAMCAQAAQLSKLKQAGNK